MGIDWTHAGPTDLAAFLASLMEFVEALTIVLAVGAVRGWRGALGGAGLALVVLLALVAVLGPALTRIPLELVQFGVGTLILMFGMRWLRKAILRSAGVIPGVVQNRVTREAGLALSGGMVAPCRFQVWWSHGSVCWRSGEAARG